ncbi:hypothetical protein OSB04_000709 [Centaurea solstitialis]|uniref:Uncharacterized protein n=1 Tax=Centaurea solstitialis TaxID=347529 RepID=A0AA38U8Z9_9ASTR|nr:hypothetical protein OSB04_000709 [Centaurea solstitialis]
MWTWYTLLVQEEWGFVVPMYTIEERVKNPVQPVCRHYHSSGWSDLPVSKRNYHFIIPIYEEWDKPLQHGALDLESHILHGVIHCDGFGHLVRINGSEGGFGTESATH